MTIGTIHRRFAFRAVTQFRIHLRHGAGDSLYDPAQSRDVGRSRKLAETDHLVEASAVAKTGESSI